MVTMIPSPTGYSSGGGKKDGQVREEPKIVESCSAQCCDEKCGGRGGEQSAGAKKVQKSSSSCSFPEFPILSRE